MNSELETYFDNFNQLFNNKGFKQLLEEISATTKQLSDVQTVKDVEELFFRKGQLAAFATIINLEDTIKVTREQAEAEEQEDIYV
jgi:hypothetical protein